MKSPNEIESYILPSDGFAPEHHRPARAWGKNDLTNNLEQVSRVTYREFVEFLEFLEFREFGE